ncbi:MAG: hypothetical protein U0804_00425 [Gemmataceae bacterium]
MADTSPLDAPGTSVGRPAVSLPPGIDTTPKVPEPPARHIDRAARAIPGILADVPSQYDGAIELVAAQLVKRLQDAGHTSVAAHWAIHQAVLAGRLRAGLVETAAPMVLPLWSSGGGHAPHRQGVRRATKAIPKGKPAPFDCFKVAATPALWDWWRVVESPDPVVEKPAAEGSGQREEPASVVPRVSRSVTRAKKSTERGEARLKLIAALTKHHRYAEDGTLNQEPINNNALAHAAGVSRSTASAFFEKQFEGHAKYRAICRKVHELTASLKLLNNEFAPHHLYGGAPIERGPRSTRTEDDDTD